MERRYNEDEKCESECKGKEWNLSQTDETFSGVFALIEQFSLFERIYFGEMQFKHFYLIAYAPLISYAETELLCM